MNKRIKVSDDTNLLLISDTHGQIDTKTLQNIIQSCNIDGCIILGDISVLDLHKIRFLYKGNIYVLLGNHDSYDLITRADCDLIPLEGKLVEINNLKFTGINGASISADYRRGIVEISDEQSINISQSLPDADILFAHDKCKHDKDPIKKGLEGISLYSKRKCCKYIIHGHYHKYTKEKIGKVAQWGVYNMCVLNIKNNGKVKIVKFDI